MPLANDVFKDADMMKARQMRCFLLFPVGLLSWWDVAEATGDHLSPGGENLLRMKLAQRTIELRDGRDTFLKTPRAPGQSSLRTWPVAFPFCETVYSLLKGEWTYFWAGFQSQVTGRLLRKTVSVGKSRERSSRENNSIKLCKQANWIRDKVWAVAVQPFLTNLV